jgi:hypothetical protein
VVRDWDRGVPVVVAVAVGPEGGARVAVGEGAEVVESGGGLGTFEAVTDILVTAAYTTIMYRLGWVMTRLSAATFWLGVWEIDDIVRIRQTGDST